MRLGKPHTGELFTVQGERLEVSGQQLYKYMYNAVRVHYIPTRWGELRAYEMGGGVVNVPASHMVSGVSLRWRGKWLRGAVVFIYSADMAS